MQGSFEAAETKLLGDDSLNVSGEGLRGETDVSP